MFPGWRRACKSAKGMATLQIPFSRWDWPNSEASSSESNNKENDQKNHKNHIHHSDNHPGYSNFISTNNNHRSDVQNCSHPRSNPIAASLSSLSAMLLEGQAVLAHQTSNAIWLFIGLNSGAIWKWTINSVRNIFIFFIYLYKKIGY